jgi:hypothetical protein
MVQIVSLAVVWDANTKVFTNDVEPYAAMKRSKKNRSDYYFQCFVDSSPHEDQALWGLQFPLRYTSLLLVEMIRYRLMYDTYDF